MNREARQQEYPRMTMPLVYISLLNWNSYAETIHCIRMIEAEQSYPAIKYLWWITPRRMGRLNRYGQPAPILRLFRPLKTWDMRLGIG